MKSSNRLKDYEIYLKRFPNGKYVNEAKAALKGSNSSEPSVMEYQAPEYVAEEAAPEVEEDEDEVEEAPKVKNKKAAKKAAKKKAKAKAKSKKRR